MRLISTLSIAVLAAILFLVSARTPALAELSAGTEIYATLQNALDTKTSHVNDPVTMTITSLYPQTALNATLQGATIHGHLAQAIAPTPTKKAYISIAFDTITLTDGRTFPFPAQVVALEKKKRINYAQLAGEALTGMLAGNVIGKSMGTNAGGSIGALGGVIYGKQMTQNVHIDANTTVKLRTTDEIAISPTRPQAR